MVPCIRECDIYWLSILCGSRCADASNVVIKVFPNVTVLIGPRVVRAVDAAGQSVSIGAVATYFAVRRIVMASVDALTFVNESDVSEVIRPSAIISGIGMFAASAWQDRVFDVWRGHRVTDGRAISYTYVERATRPVAVLR